MMRYYSLFVALLLCGCTEVDDRLGQSLLPDNQQMNVEVFTADDAVGTFLYKADSLPSSRMGYAVLGRMVDHNGVYGARSNSALLQFLPISVPYSEVDGYGLDPIIDSMNILFTVDDLRGDSFKDQRFEVYDVLEGPEELSRDSVYHANFPIADYRGDKLFEFTHKGKGDVEARLFPTAAGREYLTRIVTMEWDDYTSDSAFVKNFRGLYITPADGSPRDASAIRTALNSSGLRLHVRNHDSIDRTAIYDTITTLFSFNDQDAVNPSTGEVTEWDNVSIGMAKFDYTGSVLGELGARTNGFTDTLATSVPLETVYLQTMGGVGTFLRFTDSFIDRINDLGGGVRDVMINQAVMRLHLEDDSIESLDSSMSRVGSYTDYRHLTPIPDYQYASEGSYVIPYGGYLNRSNSYYELDITAYVQRLAAGDLAPTVYLGPDAYDAFGFGDSAVKGSGSDEPITVRVTYTTIER